MDVQNMPVTDYGICSVCKEAKAVGVCCIPGMPYSDSFCRECLTAGAIPYWAAVTNTALCGGWGQTAEWWDQIVWDTLIYLNISPVDFSLDVRRDIEEQDKYFIESAERHADIPGTWEYDQKHSGEGGVPLS